MKKLFLTFSLLMSCMGIVAQEKIKCDTYSFSEKDKKSKQTIHEGCPKGKYMYMLDPDVKDQKPAYNQGQFALTCDENRGKCFNCEYDGEVLECSCCNLNRTEVSVRKKTKPLGHPTCTDLFGVPYPPKTRKRISVKLEDQKEGENYVAANGQGKLLFYSGTKQKRKYEKIFGASNNQ